MDDSHSDGRGASRFQAGVSGRVLIGERSHTCRVENLSRSGALLVGEIPSTVGPRVSVALESAGDLKFNTVARVIRATIEPDGVSIRAAIEFDYLEPPQREVLENLISRVVEGMSPDALLALDPDATNEEIRATLEQVPVAHRIGLAVRALPRIRELLLHDTNPQVLDGLARNPSLAPPELRRLLQIRVLLPRTVERLAGDGKWRAVEELQVLIACHPNTPYQAAERVLERLSPAAKQRALGQPGLNPTLRARLGQSSRRGPRLGDGMGFLLRKLGQKRIWRRLWYERLSEPLLLNAASAFVYLFGSFRKKVEYDLIVKQPYAYGLLTAADAAGRLGKRAVSVVEFGIARGEGLLNMQRLAVHVTRETGVEVKIYGFDTGTGMPEPLDHRDHPSIYNEGDFPMDLDRLRPHLGPNTSLVIGRVEDKVQEFIEALSTDEPLGFVSVDLDYYSSTRGALGVFLGPAEKYVPYPLVYLDDIIYDFHNSWCGELAAVEEFNRANELRKLERPRFFEHGRLFRRVPWVRQMYHLYAFDGPAWNRRGRARELSNEYL